MRIIAGDWRGRRLHPLKGRGVRPTTDRVREAWMSALGGRLDGLTVVDLFAGSGALGLEAASRGAARVVLVERARSSLRVIESNVALLDAADRVEVVAGDVFRFLRDLEEEAFDVALADPPYGTGDAMRLVEAWRARPFASSLWVEHPSRESMPDADPARVRRYGDTALTTYLSQP
ncbi:MAG: 16S rRNA (guanine(966)-N(2))-methyltransferase RsmD [Longimicrobiales bacterium]